MYVVSRIGQLFYFGQTCQVSIQGGPKPFLLLFSPQCVQIFGSDDSVHVRDLTQSMSDIGREEA